MLLEHSQTLTAVAPTSIADFVDVPYSPALLLDSRFDVSLTDCPDFHDACEIGFRCYFDDMYQENGFVEYIHSVQEVLAFAGEWVKDVHKVFPDYHKVSVSWYVGFTLGWLSALALTQKEKAVRGLRVLGVLAYSVRVDAQ